MGILDIGSDQAETRVLNPLIALPRSASERFGATFSESFAEDRYFRQEHVRDDYYQRFIDDHFAKTGEALVNPNAPIGPKEVAEHGGDPAVRAGRQQVLIEKSRALREQYPDAINIEEVDRYIAEAAQRRRSKAASYVGTGNGLAAFGGAVVGETLTPHGFAGLAVPVTRLPEVASIALGRGFLANIGREGAFQAGANVAIQAATEGIDYAYRARLGTEQTAGEIAENIAGAAVAGFGIGATIRAVHLGWLRLTNAQRAAAPMEVQDAMRVVEAQELYSGRNRLGLPPMEHERLFAGSVDAIRRGQPVNLAEIYTNIDTPLTALGTILRNAPGSMPGAVPLRADVPSLATALDRMRALPDTEIEAVARELKPASFAPFDRITGELEVARERLAGLDRSAEAITMADIVDPLTGARLADIDERLKAPALRRQERLDLERERDMILESVDPGSTLRAELEKARADLETPAERAEREELAKTIERLEREQTAARSEADRETAHLRGKIDKAAPEFLRRYDDDISPDELAREFDVDPTGLEAALGRAEFNRAARLARDVAGPTAPEMPFRAPPRPAEAPSTTVADKGELPPEMKKAIDTEMDRVMSGSGNLSADELSAARADLMAAEVEIRDAQAAASCALGGFL